MRGKRIGRRTAASAFEENGLRQAIEQAASGRRLEGKAGVRDLHGKRAVAPKQHDAAANKGTDLPGICGSAEEPARPQMLTEKYFFSEPSAVPGLSNWRVKTSIGAEDCNA